MYDLLLRHGVRTSEQLIQDALASEDTYPMIEVLNAKSLEAASVHQFCSSIAQVSFRGCTVEDGDAQWAGATTEEMLRLGADPTGSGARGHFGQGSSLLARLAPEEDIPGGGLPLCRLLLRHGADPNVPDESGYTALHWAADVGKSDMCEVLVRGGADLEQEDDEGTTALQWACLCSRYNAFCKLLELGANPDGHSELNRVTPLIHAIKHSWRWVNAVVEAGANVNLTPEGQDHPLQRCIAYDNAVGAAILLHHGAQVPLSLAPTDADGEWAGKADPSGLVLALRRSRGDPRRWLQEIFVQCWGEHGDGLREIQWMNPRRAMAAIGWRTAFEARRDARLVFRAARDGRPLELDRRLYWGQLAGGLEMEGEVVGEGGVIRRVLPLEAARLGGHGECVRVIEDAMQEGKRRPRRRHG